MRIEGYVIVSANGMLADASGVMPDSLKFKGDQQYFETSLDHVDLIVHGRHSFEDQPRSAHRTRIILTSKIPAVANDPSNAKATLWNPAGATFEDACSHAHVTSGTAAIIGGPAVFDMFMDRYDVFWLSEAHRLNVPNGVGVFPQVPTLAPQAVLESHGLKPGERRILDPAENVDLTAWRRA